jgi:hypothetical protein
VSGEIAADDVLPGSGKSLRATAGVKFLVGKAGDVSILFK